MYGEPVPVQKEAGRHWQFALLSEVAYLKVEELEAQKKDGPKDDKKPVPKRIDGVTPCPHPASVLDTAGWKPWNNFPAPDLADEMKESNLRAEVWQSRDSSMVVVTFGGTVFNKL